MEIWQDTDASFEERAKDLIGRMTLEEKVSQMVFSSSALSRFGIDEYNWWNECLHGVARAGVATVFPQAIGLAASFNADLMHRVATAISDEIRAKHHEAKRQGDHGIYKGLTMWSPNINIVRDPRWGRGHETYGEDPYLTARMGVAFVRGLQGDDPKYLKAVSTPKHFAVHSGPEADRHSFDAQASIKDMKETYLPAFKACVQEAGASSVMGAYNRTNGEACCASTTLLQEILRDEWGFDGYVVSDCGAIEDIYKHHKLVDTPAEAAALAVKNGCELNCGFVFPHLMEAAQQGLITEDMIDKALMRLMMARFRLGMFDPDESVPYASIPYEVNDSEAHHVLNQEIAAESLVLLKNDGTLPADRDKTKTIAVIGPNADSKEALIGNYYGTPSVSYTVVQGFRAAMPGARIIYAEGCTLTQPNKEAAWGETPSWGFAEAISAAERADLVVLVLGMNAALEGEETAATGEGGDKNDIHLPGVQQQLLEVVASVGKPTVLLNMTGSCVDLRSAQENVNAIIQCWYPGQFGGLVMAQAVLGDFSPSGRLPITFYNDMSEIPPFTDYSMEGRTYKFFDGAPLYPFGYGLSYSEVEYRDLRGPDTIEAGEDMPLAVTLRNTGHYDVAEAVQVYLTDKEASARTPRWKLAAFDKVKIKAGESKQVEMTVKADQMVLVLEDGTEVIEPGAFTLHVGGGQPDARTAELTGRTSLEKTFTVIK